MLRHTLFMSITVLLRLASNVLLFLLLARTWGPERFGAFMYPFTLALTLTAITDFGFGLYVIRDVARRRDAARQIVATAARIKLGLCAVLMAAVGAMFWWGQWTGDDASLLSGLLLATVANSFCELFHFGLRGLGRFDLESRLAFVVNILLLGTVATVVLAGGGLAAAAASFAFARVCGLLLVSSVYRRAVAGQERSAAVAGAWTVLRTRLPFALHMGMGVVYFHIDTLMIQTFLGDRDVGLYQAAWRIFIAGNLFVEVLSNVYLSRLSAESTEDSPLLHALTARMTRQFAFLGVGGFTVLAAAAHWIVPAAYGPGYDKAILLLPILGGVLLLRYLSAPLGLLLTVFERQHIRTCGTFVALAACLVGHSLLIPRWGLAGAASTAVIANVLLAVGYAVAVRRALQLNIVQRPLLVLLAVAGGVLVLHRLTPVDSAVRFLWLGAAAVIAVRWGTRPDDWQLVRGLAGRLPQHAAAFLASLGAVFAIQRVRRLVENLLLLPAHWFSCLVPRNPKLWVCGEWFGRRYGDNSRYLYEHVRSHRADIRVVWLTREAAVEQYIRQQGGEVCRANSWRGYWTVCRAGLVIVSSGLEDVHPAACGRARKIQLWHGSPLKKIGCDDHTRRRSSRLERYAEQLWYWLFPFRRPRWDRVIATSEVFQPRMASAFRVPAERVRVTGYPRNDALFRPTPLPHFIRQARARTGAARTLLYAPTFRNSTDDNLRLFESLDTGALEGRLRDMNAILLIKMHYAARGLVGDWVNAAPHVHWLGPADELPFNELLTHTDLLITDYSGAYFDFLLLDRPVVFAPFDLAQYQSRDRQLYEKYDDVVAGPCCTTWQDVLEEAARLLSGSDPYAACRAERCAKYNAFTDSRSSARVVEVCLEAVRRSAA